MIQLLVVVILCLPCMNAIKQEYQAMFGRDGRDGIPGKDGISIMGPPGRDGRDGLSIVGPAGQPGHDGDKGLMGPIGPSGINGKDGKPGKQGIKGSMGNVGLPGNQGIDGISGKDGLPGKQGIHGINGTDGVSGKQGPKGNNGKDGLPGKQGEKGFIGQQGAKGEKGEQGLLDTKVLNMLFSDIKILQNNQLQLQQQVSNLTAENIELKKLLQLVDAQYKIKQSYLPAGYDKYSLYDIQWQSLHMAAAAVCRGNSVASNNLLSEHSHYVFPAIGGKSCEKVCTSTRGSGRCEGVVSMNGFIKKAIGSKQQYSFSSFRNWCSSAVTNYDEINTANENIVDNKTMYYCCCR